jgi:hypothetical protein
MIATVLLVAALVLFILAAIGVPSVPARFNLVAAGLACWVASLLAPLLR